MESRANSPASASDSLRTLVAEGLSVREIGERLGLSRSAVRHRLEQEGLQTVRAQRRSRALPLPDPATPEIEWPCASHGETRFRLFGGRYRCAKCASEAVSRRRRRVKRILVEESGGCCIVCGYSRYPGALQFHHLRPSEKAFPLSRQGVTRSIAEARAEAKKCVLLCSNCHAEVEAGVIAVPEIVAC